MEIDVPPGACVADLRCALAEQISELESLSPSLLIAMNNAYVGDETVLENSAELACFPPVSGG